MVHDHRVATRGRLRSWRLVSLALLACSSEARLKQNSTTSSQPPSADSPYKKPRRRPTSATPRKAGGKPGHHGHRQVLLAPTSVLELKPELCECGNTERVAPKKRLPRSSMTGRGYWSALGMESIKWGSMPGKPAWGL